VSTRYSFPGEENINSLSQALGMELPIGYSEYATSLGLGTMCTFLVVKKIDGTPFSQFMKSGSSRMLPAFQPTLKGWPQIG
jgi:hypothetical protein